VQEKCIDPSHLKSNDDSKWLFQTLYQWTVTRTISFHCDTLSHRKVNIQYNAVLTVKSQVTTSWNPSSTFGGWNLDENPRNARPGKIVRFSGFIYGVILVFEFSYAFVRPVACGFCWASMVCTRSKLPRIELTLELSARTTLLCSHASAGVVKYIQRIGTPCFFATSIHFERTSVSALVLSNDGQIDLESGCGYRYWPTATAFPSDK